MSNNTINPIEKIRTGLEILFLINKNRNNKIIKIKIKDLKASLETTLILK